LNARQRGGVKVVSSIVVMEDAQSIARASTGSGQALPDDPAALKLIIATISRQRDEAQLKAQELEVQKLRLEVELLRRPCRN
jgi:hypothetical protein